MNFVVDCSFGDGRETEGMALEMKKKKCLKKENQRNNKKIRKPCKCCEC